MVMLEMLENTSDLKISHLICNTNLMEFTTEEIVEKGVKIISNIAEEKDLVFEYFLVLDKYEDKIPDEIAGKKKKILRYYLSKPWEKQLYIKGI